MEKIIIQITAGRGPVECCRVVAKVQERMLTQARKIAIETEVLENKKADLKGTLLSATILAKGENLQAFVKEWRDTVQWISPESVPEISQAEELVCRGRDIRCEGTAAMES
jgi:peptide chain release factor